MCEDKRILISVFKSKTIIIMSQQHIVRLNFNKQTKFFGHPTAYKKQLIEDVLDIDDRRRDWEKRINQGGRRSISNGSYNSARMIRN